MKFLIEKGDWLAYGAIGAVFVVASNYAGLSPVDVFMQGLFFIYRFFQVVISSF